MLGPSFRPSFAFRHSSERMAGARHEMKMRLKGMYADIDSPTQASDRSLVERRSAPRERR